MFAYSKPLQSVAWASMRHAYGKAADVPAMLEGWVSDDADARLDAYHRVISALWHQGSIYQATGYAVPFLVDLVCAADAPCRSRAATALALIATAAAHGADAGEAHGRHVIVQLGKATPQLVETALREPALRQILLVVLAQVRPQRAFVEQSLRASGHNDEVRLLDDAGAGHAAAFEHIGRYGDESDPADA